MLRSGRVLDEVEGLARSDPAPTAHAIGPPEQKFRAFEQIFGASRQVPHMGGCDNGLCDERLCAKLARQEWQKGR
jgi:hypothetical protein